MTGGTRMHHSQQLEAQWHKSSYSSDTANCVEVAFTESAVDVRDSKNTSGPTLAFPTTNWTRFLNHP
jgi:hypothetical protein